MIPAIKVLLSKKHFFVLENKKNLITLTHKPFQGLPIDGFSSDVTLLSNPDLTRFQRQKTKNYSRKML